MRVCIAISACALLLTGCGAEQTVPSFSGTVSALFESESEGAHKALEDSGQFDAGCFRDDTLSDGWKVSVDWSLMAVKDSKATYRFNYEYILDSGEPVSGSSDITFDGLNRTVAVVDDQFSIAIDPRSLRRSPRGEESSSHAEPKHPTQGPIWAEG